MTDMPVVTVVTPSYNQGRFIEQTIKSVLSQDYPHVEYIVIDGGSTDNTIEVLKKYTGRIDWISEPDEGQVNAINKGFKKARGDILCWLNSDDTYEPGAIRRAVEFFIENPDVMMVYGEGNEIDENGSLIQRFPATQKFDLWALVYIWDYILQPTTFFRKSVFDEIGMLNEDYYWCMDWDLWIRIGSRFKVSYIDYVFANSRIYPETKTGAGRMRRIREIVSVMRKYGKRRYPLGFFVFGEDTLEIIFRERFPRAFRLLESTFLRARIALNNKRSTYQGIYADKWMGPKASFMFPANSNIDAVKFEVELPQYPELYPNVLSIRMNGGKPVIHHIKNPGRFDFEITLHSSEGIPMEVELEFNKTFQPENEKRRMSCFLHDIRFLPDMA